MRQQSKYILLGVAMGWGRRKGLDIFLKLSELLGDNYIIMLVGVDDSKQVQCKNIIYIDITESVDQLAEIYTAADIFVNPTLEDNYPTVNLESLACGTPVITYNTGGSPESIRKGCGLIIYNNDVNTLYKEIIENTERLKSNIIRENCTDVAKDFDEKKMYVEYINLYELSEGISV